MIVQPSFACLFQEDVEAAQRLFDMKKGGSAKPFRFRLRRKDGTQVWVDVQGTRYTSLLAHSCGSLAISAFKNQLHLGAQRLAFLPNGTTGSSPLEKRVLWSILTIQDTVVFVKSAVMENFLREEWLFLYQFALVEIARERMSGRVSAAQWAIATRLERLSTMPESHREERQAMQDAARTLTFLEREAERFDVKAESSAIEESMQQPASVHPTIQQLGDRADAASP